jgi:hypothetical protein
VAAQTWCRSGLATRSAILAAEADGIGLVAPNPAASTTTTVAAAAMATVRSRR